MAGAEFWGNAAAEGPTFAPHPWDIVFIGDPLPGICEVKGIAQLELDKKKQKGTNGLTLTVTGYQPSPFEVAVLLWTQEQWEFMQAWIDKFWITPQKERPQFTTTKKRTGSNKDGTPIFTSVTTKNRAPQVAVDISHPALAAIGIASCTVQGISIPEAASAEGTKTIKIKVVENRPSEKKTVVKTARASVNVPLDRALRPKEKSGTPEKPSADRANLGPNGPKTPPASGSD